MSILIREKYCANEVTDMKNNFFGVLQRVGRSFMLPIAILPVAGLLLGIGGSFSNTTMLSAYGLMGLMGPGTVPNMIFTVMSQAGDIVFANLPILFVTSLFTNAGILKWCNDKCC